MNIEGESQMKASRRLISLILLGIGFVAVDVFSEPITCYQSLTNYEITRFNEYIWFGEDDSLWSIIRSNGYIGIYGAGPIGGWIITTEDRLLRIHGNDPLRCRVTLNAPVYRFPQQIDYLRENCDEGIDGQDGRYMTQLRFRADTGIEVHQYPLGEEPQDSLINTLDPSVEIIFVDGQVEVEGIVYGRHTVYSSGDMWLINDIRYDGANEMNGQFIESEMDHMLCLASERNIIIANTVANGRENGWNEGADPHDIAHHSIIINGSLIAMNESFTFQDQNDDDDEYQGPIPDERGIIHLKGGIAQYRRGYVHRSNHIGTGYGKDYHWDFRLDSDAPPGFRPGEYPDISGQYDEVLMFAPEYHVREAAIHKLVIYPGVTVNLEGSNALRIYDTLFVNGEPDDSVFFKPYPLDSQGVLWVDGGGSSQVKVSYADFAKGVRCYAQAETLTVDHSRFGDIAQFQGDIILDSSLFASAVEVTSWDNFLLRRSLLLGGLAIRGNADGVLLNNTITGSRFDGLKLERFNTLDIRNNIICFNRFGIRNEHWDAPTLEYNDVYDNRDEDYRDCEPGEGSLSRDPLFEDARRGDFRLAWNSPARDAGDPDSPPDPDGSRADMGAHYTDVLGVDVDADADVESEALSVSPNPFNSQTVASYELRGASRVNLALYDINGRLVQTLTEGWEEAGEHWAVIDANRGTDRNVYPTDLPSGVYLLRLTDGRRAAQRKVCLIK
jgi:hypothetical protein